MERKTIDTLHMMLCGELEDLAKKNLTHESLDIIKDLLQSIHYLNKMEEKEMESEEMNGYSQRAMGRYYIDGQYGSSRDRGYDFGTGYRDGGNSYNRPMYNDMGGNSYAYYDPRYDQPMRRGYSRTGSKMEMIEELKEMMKETNDEVIRAAISDAIGKMEK